jgi:hypothetical protein
MILFRQTVTQNVIILCKMKNFCQMILELQPNYLLDTSSDNMVCGGTSAKMK